MHYVEASQSECVACGEEKKRYPIPFEGELGWMQGSDPVSKDR